MGQLISKELIIENRENPPVLEELYRKDRNEFSRIFPQVYQLYPDSAVLAVWQERLFFKPKKGESQAKGDIILIIILSLAAAGLMKLFFELNRLHIGFPGNMLFSVFPVLSLYFLIKKGFPLKTTITTGASYLLTAFFINLQNSNTWWLHDVSILSLVHLPFLLWSFMGVSFSGEKINSHETRMDFLRYSGEMLIYTAIILLFGAILTVITIGLFSFININIEVLYFETVVIMGLGASPIVGTYLFYRQNKEGISLAPIISRIFSPLLAITLLVYLVFIFVTGKNPYDDRDFHFLLNVLLLGVLAIAVFVISEMKKEGKKVFHYYTTALLVLLALIIDIFALSAAVFRLFTMGLTPNRLAVAGITAIVCVHLVLINLQYCKYLFLNGSVDSIKRSVTVFLPVYSVWTFIVTIGFPLFPS